MREEINEAGSRGRAREVVALFRNGSPHSAAAEPRPCSANHSVCAIMGRPAVPARGGVRAMTNPQEQFTELTHRTQENFKRLWEQWSQRSNELLKGVSGRSRPTGEAPGNPEEVLDAVFDFAENLIAQQRAFAKQMLRAASKGQQAVADSAEASEIPTGSTGVPSTPGVPGPTTTPGAFPAGEPGR
jgi:hypothetical protein